MSDLISRADAIKAIRKCKFESVMPSDWYRGMEDAIHIVETLPSAETHEIRTETHGVCLISKDDAMEAVCRTRCGDKAKGCPAHSCLVIEEFDALPSADAVDCTDFIEWLVDRVLDETIWEYNSVAYGEIICRKLEKLGVLEVTEEPSYYIRPSADAVSENTQTEEQARFVAKETELAHIEARLENAEKRLQGVCVANFVAEQLERLREMTDEKKLEFFRKFFGMGKDGERREE